MRRLLLVLFLVFALGSGFVFAEEALQVTLDQFVVESTTEEGRERLLPFDGQSGPPGTVLEYQLTVENTRDAPLSDIILTLPIPEGTRYVETAEDTQSFAMLLQLSIDGGESFRVPPIRYIVEKEDGRQEYVVAGPEMITHLRLIFLQPLSVRGQEHFSYRVVVE